MYVRGLQELLIQAVACSLSGIARADTVRRGVCPERLTTAGAKLNLAILRLIRHSIGVMSAGLDPFSRSGLTQASTVLLSSNFSRLKRGGLRTGC